MKHYLNWIKISPVDTRIVGVSALPSMAVTRPFHLVEHGTLSTTNNGDILALVTDGTGTATHLGRIEVHRTATLKRR